MSNTKTTTSQREKREWHILVHCQKYDIVGETPFSFPGFIVMPKQFDMVLPLIKKTAQAQGILISKNITIASVHWSQSYNVWFLPTVGTASGSVCSFFYFLFSSKILFRFFLNLLPGFSWFSLFFFLVFFFLFLFLRSSSSLPS